MLVWNELYRSSATLSQSGSGIGLALVKCIVEGHGGRVELASRTGYGTRSTMRQ